MWQNQDRWFPRISPNFLWFPQISRKNPGNLEIVEIWKRRQPAHQFFDAFEVWVYLASYYTLTIWFLKALMFRILTLIGYAHLRVCIFTLYFHCLYVFSKWRISLHNQAWKMGHFHVSFLLDELSRMNKSMYSYQSISKRRSLSANNERRSNFLSFEMSAAYFLVSELMQDIVFDNF